MTLNYEAIIGLEVHIELSTHSKMFCGCSADYFGAEPNSHVCPVCLGLPGALPYPNQKAIEHVVLLGLAIGATVAKTSKFDRKHYFYPDLPKGYQISQYDMPLTTGGVYKLSDHDIRIRRVHLEEDTAKLTHTKVHGKSVTLVDFNRSGVALMEMVTEPDFRDSSEVVEFLKDIQRSVRDLGISDADMEKGSMRLEANVSVRKIGDMLPDYKVELKNINSFRFLKNAIDYEVGRQTQLLKLNNKVRQETRGYNEKSDETFLQRTKEKENDYRYFPEPDIPPLTISDSMIQKIKMNLVDLPWERRRKFSVYNLPKNYIEVLAETVKRSDYFESAVQQAALSGVDVKNVASAMVNQNLDLKLNPTELVNAIAGESKRDYLSPEETKLLVNKILTKNPDAVLKYKGGKKSVIGFLVGAVQKETTGNADPKLVIQILNKELDSK